MSTFSLRHHAWIVFLLVIVLAACTAPRAASVPMAVPTAGLASSRTPAPDCSGWWCTLSGTVYSDAVSSGQQLADATVTLQQTSYCSPTGGQYTITTKSDGKFAFQVYLHDTDSFFFHAEKAGAPPVEKKFGGFDCLYCSCKPLDLVLSSPSTTTIQALPKLTEVGEAWHLLSAQGNQVWPGWGASRIPLLIRAGEFDLLIGHPSPPPGFSLLSGATLADQPVYRYAGHLVPTAAATAWEVGGVWSVAVPTREEFQQAIDAQLGKGVVNLDAANYVRTLVHEAFHAYTFQILNGPPPSFGGDVDERTMIEKLSALPDLDKQHSVEGQALVKALQAADDQVARKAAIEFLGLRRARRAGDQEIVSYEQTTEWVEGLARYADVSLMQHAGQATYTPLDKAIKYPSADEVWQQFLDQLANPAASPDGFRGRYYLLGAGQAFLLDRLMPDWKTQVFSEKQSLEDLLEQATH